MPLGDRATIRALLSTSPGDDPFPWTVKQLKSKWTDFLRDTTPCAVRIRWTVRSDISGTKSRISRRIRRTVLAIAKNRLIDSARVRDANPLPMCDTTHSTAQRVQAAICVAYLLLTKRRKIVHAPSWPLPGTSPAPHVDGPGQRKAELNPVHSVDQLYVISDLHLGGTPGFQIFGSAGELAWLINDLATRDPEREIALVINGDFIDFLAEPNATYFDPEGAVAKLERIALQDPMFRPVFDAFPVFLQQNRRPLIVNLGNHDLELALPWVRERLTQILTKDAPSSSGAHARLHFVFDGSGVQCDVGGQSVLCVHGNEVDRWNPADFEKIRQIGRDKQLRRPVEPWVPNAGSRMVIDVMNPIKRKYPFVDLLKPEAEGVVPTLAACAPEAMRDFNSAIRLANVGRARAWAGIYKPGGMLGAEELAAGDPVQPVPVSGGLLNPVELPASRQECDGRAMLAVADALVRHGVDPLAFVANEQDKRLDMVSALIKWSRDAPTSEVLREALEKLDKDRSFDIAERDETSTLLDKEIGPDIDIIVAGHTHLARALRRRNGNGRYFNSGTWARLIRIDPETRSDPQKFAEVFDVLKGGDIRRSTAFAPDHWSLTPARSWPYGRKTTVTVRKPSCGTSSSTRKPSLHSTPLTTALWITDDA
ncbi:metallophosphoesterase family protein [Paraburkholderia aromaticivorans]|uniref:metallophosphoesterase family protein n=1 Tax=Paraburkholderia aromaticivorans TaxID=2026199 RepID=UPI001F113EAB|nr:metallophosphoesterase family protein [Paraburkholderia aromaticivorans]